VRVFPASEEEVSALLKYANERGKSVSVEGNGSKRGFGGLRESYDIALSLSKHAGIVEHQAGDMIVTVKAGTPFGELQDFLRRHRQQVPLDPALPHLSTIGGVIAANDSGPKRLGYGSARDAVLGLRVVYPDGTVIRTGGKVVKNVAGYDMNKLFIGSMGTLGVITEITLKLRPVPKAESVVLVSFGGNPEDAREFIVRILDSVLEPVALELLSPSMAERLTGNKALTLAVCFEDVEGAVADQENRTVRLAPRSAGTKVLRGEEIPRFWERLSGIVPGGRAAAVQDPVTAALKIGVKNMDVLPLLLECERLAERLQTGIAAHGGAGHGLCRAVLKGSPQNVEAAIREIRDFAEKRKGYAAATHLPFFLRQRVGVWGEVPGYLFLMEGIKNKIDPRRVLNDRRFIGGI